VSRGPAGSPILQSGGSFRVNINQDGFTIQSISRLSQITSTQQIPTKALFTATINVEHVNSHQHKLITTCTADNGRPT